jgi:hypothetical protein
MVMFAAFLVAACFSLNEIFTDLSHRAHAMSKRPRASFPGRAEYVPGHYDFGFMTFSLSRRVIGGYTASVSGYAFAHSILAVISDPISPGTIFVDAERQILLQVTNSFLSDNLVTFYNVTIQNPLSVLINLKMKTTGIDTGFDCSARLGSASARCRRFAKYRWNEATDRPIPIEVLDSVHLLLGAFLEATASAQVSFKGLQNVNLDYAFGIEGRLGAGFWVNRSIVYRFPQRDPFTFEIAGWNFSFLGLNVTLSVDGYVRLSIREIEVELPKSLEYYRVFKASVHKEGSISTKGGFTTSPMAYELTTNAPQSIDLDDLFEAVLGLKLHVKPELDFGVTINVVLGSLVDYTIQLGALVESVWSFSLNLESCPCPYLYGRTVTDMKLYVDSQDLKLFGYTLLKNFHSELPLITGFETPWQCIFSPQESKEGVLSLRDDVNVPSYVISGFKFTMSNFQSGIWSFRPTIQSVESTGHVLEDLQLAQIDWNQSLLGTQTATRKGLIIISMLPTDGSIRWFADEAIFWNPRNATVTINLSTGEQTTSIGNISDVEYNVVQVPHVEIFKEFPGRNNSYISFKPTIPTGSLLGAIVHSVNEESPYAAPLLQQVFDESSMDSNGTEFVGKDQVEIAVVSFCPKYASTVQLTFKRGSSQLKIALANHLTPGISVSNPFNIQPVTVDLNNQNPLTIEVLLERSIDDYISESVTISREELNRNNNLTIERSSVNFNMTLAIVPTQPDVVFQFAQPLTETQRAIVCRVFQGFSNVFEVILEPAECYGIIRFQNVSLPISASVIALISMPGLTALCDHRRLDSNRVVIPLITGLTIFESNIHIPFRRAAGGFNTTVRLENVFATTGDGLCGSGVNITTRSEASVACLETVVNNETDSEGWTAILPSAGISTAAITIPGIGWRLYVFEVPAGSIDLLPSIFTIPENVTFLQLPGSAVQPFAMAGLPVFVRCNRAERIEKICGIPSTTHQVERGANGLFALNACVDTDLLITAVCNNSASAFCQFTVKLDERTLLEYGSPAGVFEVSDNTSSPGALLPGISRQVIGRRGPVQAYKSWSGPIVQAAVIKNPANLTVTAIVYREKVTLSLTFGNLSVPFSAEKYYDDPEGFFIALGIGKPADGYHPEIVNFTDNADVVVSSGAIDLDVAEGGINVERTTDLPQELVTGQEFVLQEQNDEPTEEPKPNQKRCGVGAIVGIVVAVIAAVVAIFVVLWLACRKSKTGDNGLRKF